MHTIKIKDNHYKVMAEVETNPGMKVPLVDLPLMTDETWNKLASSRINRELLDKYGRK